MSRPPESADASQSLTEAVAYYRFSPRPKGAGVKDPESIDVQRDRCRAYCEREGLTIAHEVAEPHVSGRTRLFDRKKRDELRIALYGVDGRAPRRRHIVAMRLDRLFRSVADGIQTMDAWGDAGIAMHLADEGGASIRTDTAAGWMTAASLLVHSEFSARLTAERTSQAMLRHMQSGRAMGGTAPYGYRIEEGCILVDHEEREAIRLIRLYRAVGESWSCIAEKLNEKCIPSRGEKWTHAAVQRAAACESATGG